MARGSLNLPEGFELESVNLPSGFELVDGDFDKSPLTQYRLQSLYQEAPETPPTNPVAVDVSAPQSIGPVALSPGQRQQEAAEIAGFGPGSEVSPYLQIARKVVEEEAASKIPTASDSFLSRIGKGLWNSVVALPAYAVKTDTEVGKAQTELHALGGLEKDFRRRAFSGEPVTEAEIDWYTAPYAKGSFGSMLGSKRPFWAETVQLNYQQGRLNLVDELPKEQVDATVQGAMTQAKLKQSQIADISMKVSEAQGFKDKAADVLAGVTGFGIRLALLRKAFPDLPPAMIWEVENEVTGGTPGKGLLTYGLFNAPGKIIPQVTKAGKVAAVAAESALLGGATALESKIAAGEIDWKQVAISAGIPAVFRTPKYVRSRLLAGDMKVLAAAEVASQHAKTRPVNFEPTAEAASENLSIWSETAKVVEKEQWQPALKKLRKEQHAGGQAAETLAVKQGASAEEALRAIPSGFKGKAVRPDVEPPKLTPQQWNKLSEKTQDVYSKDPFTKSSVQKALDNLRYRGKIPTPTEFGQLEPILGRETTIKLYNNIAKQKTYSSADAPRLARDLAKTKFGLDPQAARQFSLLQERHPGTWLKAVEANLKAYASNVAAERGIAKLKADPMFKLAQEKEINLLGMEPWSIEGKEGQRLQQFETAADFLESQKSVSLRAYGKLLAASERGANYGINVGLTDLTREAYKDLQRAKIKYKLTPKEEDAFWKSRAADINVFSKRIQAKNPKLKEIQRAANWVMFSPAYTIARPMGTYRAVKNLLTGPKGNRTYAAQVVGFNLAATHAKSMIVAYIGYRSRLQHPDKEPKVDSSTDPRDPLWGHIRIGNDVIDLTGGEAGYYRALSRVGVGFYAMIKSQVTGEQVTDVAGRRVDKPGEVFTQYLKNRETALLGLAQTLATGKDWLGRPIDPVGGRLKELVRAAGPEPIIAIVEAGLADGLWESMLQGDVRESGRDLLSNLPVGLMGLLGLGVNSYPVPAISTRSDFQEILADEEYKKSWTDLTPKEQKVLHKEYKPQFEELDKKIQTERVDNPVNVQRIMDEEKASGDRVRGKLSKINQTKIESKAINLSRRPEDFYLNDSRFNRYEELVVENLNKNLSRFNAPKEKTIDILVKRSKDKAWRQVKREMR